MKRRKIAILVVLPLILILFGIAVPAYLSAAKTSRKNACINNLQIISAGSESYCMAARLSYGHTFTAQQFSNICEYIKGCKPPTCPVINRPCIPAPYSVYEGPKCPCGQELTPFDAVGKPWDGDFRTYLAALQEDLRPAGMRLGSDALLRLTPLMFNRVAVRNFILSNLEQWYENPFNTDMIACAASALGNIKDPRAVETLIKGISCEEWYARKKIAEALGDIGDKRAIEPLKTLLEDKDERVRKSATEALKKFQSDG